MAGDGNNDTIKLVQAAAYDVRLAASTDSLTISRPVTIAGSGVDAASTLRPRAGVGNFNMFVISSPSTVTIQGVIIRDVNHAHAMMVNSGASARLMYSWVLNSGSSGDSTGGALWNKGGLTLSNVEFSGCQGWLSGAVYNTGSVFIDASAFVGNDGARVGAFPNNGSTAWASINNTTFGKNIANNQATAIANFNGGFLELNGVTVFNNGVESNSMFNIAALDRKSVV